MRAAGKTFEIHGGTRAGEGFVHGHGDAAHEGDELLRGSQGPRGDTHAQGALTAEGTGALTLRWLAYIGDIPAHEKGVGGPVVGSSPVPSPLYVPFQQTD